MHYYRNLAGSLTSRGHQVYWSIKDLPVIKKLLDQYGFQYETLSKKSDGLTGKILKQLQFTYKLYRFCRRKKIDLAFGTSVTITHLSKISKIKSLVFDDDDDDVQPLVTKYVNPFASTLVSPDVLSGKRKRKDTVFYPGYHELAYLHPNWFTPDPQVLREAGLEEGEPFFVMRFNVFKAHHDTGVKGLSLEQKLHLIDLLKPKGKIFITTEREIEAELKEYQLPVSPENIHSLMAYSTIFLGDSQTMTSEAAVLGVPSLRCNSFAGRISYLEEQEKKYGLTYAFTPDNFEELVKKLKELLNHPNLREEWQKRRFRMLSEKIDVSSFWAWLIENYPSSLSEMKDQPEFWAKFK